MVTITELNEKIPLTKKGFLASIEGIEADYHNFVINNRDLIKDSQKALKGDKFNHTQLNNKLNNIIKWITELDINENLLDILVEEVNYSSLVDYTTKEGDLIKIMDQSNFALFTRRSDGKQSVYEVEDIINQLDQKGTIMFSEDSSSFKDLAFLRFLQYCIDNNIRNVKVISFTRTKVETVTRSYENALKINLFIDQNFQHFDSIIVGGINLMDQLMRAVFLLTVSTLEGKWLMTANTKYYFKHEIYLRVLLNEATIEDIPLLGKEQPTKAQPTIKEFKAFYYYNDRNYDEFKSFLLFLKNKKKN